MQDQFETSHVVAFLLANALGLLAAARAWAHSKEARALLEDLVHDVGEDLREHIVVAAAEAAAEVIANLPKKRTPPALPPAVTQ